MIQTVWPYLAVMLLAAGIFPALERRTGWKFFSVFPPIVLVYLSLTALAVIGLWQVTPEIKAAQGLLIKQLVPALIFLLMVNCDLRAIFALGPRVLAVFFCTSISLFIGFVLTYLAFRHWLPHYLVWSLLLVTPLGLAHGLIDLRLVAGAGEGFWPLALVDGPLSTLLALVGLGLGAAAYRRVA